jgi:integrase
MERLHQPEGERERLMLDLDSGTLKVNRQLQRRRRDGNTPSELVFSEPKNASRRTVRLPLQAIEALKSPRKHQIEKKLEAPNYEASGLVFAMAKGDRTPFVMPLTMRVFVRILLARLLSTRTLPG